MQILKESYGVAVLCLTAVIVAATGIASLIAPRPVVEVEEVPVTDTLPRGMNANYVISPYDSLIRYYSDSAGLDWRLVAAVIYHESGFDNDVRSHRGATGLMQMMPSTARRMGAENPDDPIQGVKAGTRYLKHLHGSFVRHVDDPGERLKFTLAAYNAGTGRILDCINYARYRGVDTLSWDAVVELIPEMSDDSILELDTIKFGKFKGVETIAFVRNVLDRYEQYRSRVPR